MRKDRVTVQVKLFVIKFIVAWLSEWHTANTRPRLLPYWIMRDIYRNNYFYTNFYIDY